MNCSDQMNYKTMANIFSGLSQTGAWGCFDEFNRIPVEVLSVVAGQYGALLDGIKAAADSIVFEEEKINLRRTVGAFITMNPGYAGRTELPENLKALFRGVAMCTPDFAAIIEIELSAEGFISAKPLSIKFIRLFQLNMELLSKQDHYDWGLRAIKVSSASMISAIPPTLVATSRLRHTTTLCTYLLSLPSLYARPPTPAHLLLARLPHCLCGRVLSDQLHAHMAVGYSAHCWRRQARQP